MKYEIAIDSILRAIQEKDSDTETHLENTKNYFGLLINKMYEDGCFKDILTPQYVEHCIEASQFHDIGKIVIADSILKAPRKLTEQEYNIIKIHTIIAKELINDFFFGFNHDFKDIIIDIATSHHERYDGNGYPYQIKGNDIPLCARIMAVVDVFDALVSKRCYKEPLSFEDAFKELERNSDTQFDPVILEEFFKLKPLLIELERKK